MSLTFFLRWRFFLCVDLTPPLFVVYVAGKLRDLKWLLKENCWIFRLGKNSWTQCNKSLVITQSPCQAMLTNDNFMLSKILSVFNLTTYFTWSIHKTHSPSFSWYFQKHENFMNFYVILINPFFSSVWIFFLLILKAELLVYQRIMNRYKFLRLLL
jgi:hypothetical protein